MGAALQEPRRRCVSKGSNIVTRGPNNNLPAHGSQRCLFLLARLHPPLQHTSSRTDGRHGPAPFGTACAAATPPAAAAQAAAAAARASPQAGRTPPAGPRAARGARGRRGRDARAAGRQPAGPRLLRSLGVAARGSAPAHAGAAAEPPRSRPADGRHAPGRPRPRPRHARMAGPVGRALPAGRALARRLEVPGRRVLRALAAAGRPGPAAAHPRGAALRWARTR